MRGGGTSITASLAAAALLVLSGCNASLPNALTDPAVLESSPRVDKRLFAEVAHGGNIFDLRQEPDGGITALTGTGAYRFDRDGQIVDEVRFEVAGLYRTRFLPAESVLGRYLGWGRGSLSFLSAAGELRGTLPSARALAVGDIGADDSFDLVRAVERNEECPFPRYCTWMEVHDLGSGAKARRPTPFILTDVEIVPGDEQPSGHVVLMMYPDDDGGSAFEVRDGELHRRSSWHTARVGDFSLARRQSALRVLTNEGDHLVFRDFDGSETGRLDLPDAGRLRNTTWSDLADGWGVAVVSGVQAPRFVLAIYDEIGRRVYREVGAPHADALLVPEEARDRFYVAQGSDIFEYRLQPVGDRSD